MLNPRHRLVWFVSAVVLSLGIAVASPSPVSAATSLTANCGFGEDRSVTVASGETISVNAFTGTCGAGTPIINWAAGTGVTGTPTAGFDSTANTWKTADPFTNTISFTSVAGGGATIWVCEDAASDGGCDDPGDDYHKWLITVSAGGGGSSGGSSGSSGSSNTGCEVAGKPCAVRPWPWPIAYTDYINISWEALIPAEAGTGGVTSYRVESTPAGGTCILRLSEVAAGESLPTTCNITGLETDTDYTFTVYASSAYGEGPGRSTQEAVRLLAAATPAVTVPAVAPETPAPTLPATGQHTVLVGAAVLLIGLGALATLSVRRRRDLSQMAQAVRRP
jgi:LPXTG-motif cell wall-anchored protein